MLGLVKKNDVLNLQCILLFMLFICNEAQTNNTNLKLNQKLKMFVHSRMLCNPSFALLKVLFICREKRGRSTGHLHREELWQVWHCGTWTWTRHWLLAWAHATWPRRSRWYISRKHPAGYSHSLLVNYRMTSYLSAYSCYYKGF